MSVENCPECNKIFQKQKHDVCSECYEQDLSKFKKVRALIRETPSISLNGILTKTNISLDTLLRWKRNGRI